MGLLEGLVKANQVWLANAKFPRLYESGVVYRREGIGKDGQPTEIWRSIPVIYSDGYGDCEDLSCWRCAELREGGTRAYPLVYQTKTGGFHVVVRKQQYGKWVIEDPSRKLGM